MNIVNKILQILPNATYHRTFNLVISALEIPVEVQEKALEKLKERYGLRPEEVELFRKALHHLNNKLLLYVDLPRRKISYEFLLKQKSFADILKILKPDIDLRRYSDLIDILFAYLFDYTIAHYKDLIEHAWKILLEDS